MGALLGWMPRLPLVAPCDRARVLDLWAQQLGGGSGAAAVAVRGGSSSVRRGRRSRRSRLAYPPSSQPSITEGGETGRVLVRQRYLPFADVREMSPADFVALLADDLKAAGVVAGANFRFGVCHVWE
jgi:hypothetical protein